jgi:hypothetical protein
MQQLTEVLLQPRQLVSLRLAPQMRSGSLQHQKIRHQTQETEVKSEVCRFFATNGALISIAEPTRLIFPVLTKCLTLALTFLIVLFRTLSLGK